MANVVCYNTPLYFQYSASCEGKEGEESQKCIIINLLQERLNLFFNYKNITYSYIKEIICRDEDYIMRALLESSKKYMNENKDFLGSTMKNNEYLPTLFQNMQFILYTNFKIELKKNVLNNLYNNIKKYDGMDSDANGVIENLQESIKKNKIYVVKINVERHQLFPSNKKTDEEKKKWLKSVSIQQEPSLDDNNFESISNYLNSYLIDRIRVCNIKDTNKEDKDTNKEDKDTNKEDKEILSMIEKIIVSDNMKTIYENDLNDKIKKLKTIIKNKESDLETKLSEKESAKKTAKNEIENTFNQTDLKPKFEEGIQKIKQIYTDAKMKHGNNETLRDYMIMRLFLNQFYYNQVNPSNLDDIDIKGKQYIPYDFGSVQLRYPSVVID